VNHHNESEDDESSQEQDGVWTSNSDLFMAIAVVFLIMFVFSMIAARIQKAEVVKERMEQEQYDEGRIPVKKMVQHQKDVHQLVNSIVDIQTQQEILQKDLKHMNKLSDTLAEKKNIFMRLQQEHMTKNVALQKASQKIDYQDMKIVSLSKNLNKVSANLKKSERVIKSQSSKIIKNDKKIEDLVSKNDLKEQTITELTRNEKAVNQKLAKQEALIKEFESQMQSNQNKIANLNNQVEDSRGQLKEKSSLASNLEKNLSDIQKSLTKSNNKNGKLASKLSKQESAHNELLGELDAMYESLGDAKSQVAGYKKTQLSLNKDITIRKVKNKKLEKKVKKQVEHIRKIDKELKQTKKSLKVKSSSIMVLQNQLKEIKGGDRTLADNIAQKMQNAGIEVFIDPQSGMLVLRLDDSFLFKRNSYELTDPAKVKIKDIIPKYAESLFADEKNRSRVSSVSITGYASPRYKKQYVDPLIYDVESYNYNLDLSYKRAQEVAKYIFGEQIGGFRFKDLLRMKAQVAGKSHMLPIKALKVKSENEQKLCGEYDCSKSRRVEISFLLKPTKRKESQLIGH